MHSTTTPAAARLALALAALALSGCVMARQYVNQPIDEQKIATIQRGVTTKTEILALLGPPQEIDARELTAIGVSFEPFYNSAGEPPPIERIVAARYFRYVYLRGNGSGLILVLFNYFEFDQKSDNLVIFFNGDDRVQDFAYARDTDRLPRFGFLSR